MLDWFNSRKAAEAGSLLADVFASRLAPHAKSDSKVSQEGCALALAELLRGTDSEVRPLRLNIYKKARFLNSFKWRLIENGIARALADDVTQSLVLHLSSQTADPQPQQSPVPHPDRPPSTEVKHLLARGNECFACEAYADAVEHYRRLLELDADNILALYNLGTALSKMGFPVEAEQHLRRVLKLSPNHVEAHCILGIVLRARGELRESDIWLRQALKLNPNFVQARLHHAVTLLALGRVREARARITKVLKTAPRNAEAGFLMGHIAKMEGRFDEAESRFKQALTSNPTNLNALAALASVRKMTTADGAWLEDAKKVAESATPAEEVDLRFAIGKYCDDVEDFEQAFENFKRANQLLRAWTDPYEPDARACFVDDMIRIYTPEAIASVRAGISASTQPIFVVGMPRSGTSLAEQIIASHPSAKGAGEVGFCDDTMQAPDSELRQGLLSAATRGILAEMHLRTLSARAGDALRIVDKAPINSDYLGAIYSVFPNARIIHTRRDPIDTCLSCYFQRFSAGINFASELPDLVHYFRQHSRLMKHWRGVLPRESMLEVPYEELVADQAAWTRKILEFLDLEWDERCLEFHKTERQVVTLSAWQVRQKMYGNSVGRWRNYKKFITPLLDLAD
jgi:tetratricopeptide (TPR) repeat protein